MERQLLPDRRQRLTLQEIARVLVGAALGFAIGAFRDDALVGRHPVLLGARELGRGEAESRDPLQLGYQRLEAAGHAVIRYQCLEQRLIPGPRHREQTAIRRGAEEGRVLALAHLVESGAEHRGEELVHHDGAIPADRPLIAGRA